MENASKALLMAGGVLLTLLIISLFIFAWGRISEYQNAKDELTNIENTAKFNEQFAQYDRSDVQGYELLTLIHKVIDYNERRTTDSINNADSYPYITLEISMLTKSGSDNRTSLTIDDNVRLFTKTVYRQNELSAKNRNDTNSFEKGIEVKIKTAMQGIGAGSDEDKANKVAKNINSIFMTETEIETKANNKYNGNKNFVYEEMVRVYNSCTGESMSASEAQTKLVIGKNADTNKYYVYACQCYEYMQFKRSIFECKDIVYDNSTGRVSEIYFNFVKVR